MCAYYFRSEMVDLRTKERREDVGMIIANAVKIGIEKIGQETILERY